MNNSITPLVSVILPTFNRAPYLEEAIQSILDQTYQDLELIIVDDGSTDNTSELVHSFKDTRIRYIVFESNRGVIAARNKGLEIARGTYIAFADSDDRSFKGRLAAQVQILNQYPAVGVCSNDLQHFGDRQSVWSLDGGDLIKVRALFDMPVHFPSSMVRKSILDQYNIQFVAEYPPTEDYFFLLEIVTKTDAYIIPQTLYWYRWNKNNISIVREKEGIENGEKISAIAFQWLLDYELPKAEHELLYHLYHGRLNLEQLNAATAIIENLIQQLSIREIQTENYRKTLERLLFKHLFQGYFMLSPLGFRAFRYFIKSKVWLRISPLAYGLMYLKFFIKSLIKM